MAGTTGWTSGPAGPARRERRSPLRPKEFELLAPAVDSAGEAVRRERLMDEVWDEHWSGSTKTLDVHVANLRRKLADAGDRWDRIATLRGFGYRFEPTAGLTGTAGAAGPPGRAAARPAQQQVAARPLDELGRQPQPGAGDDLGGKPAPSSATSTTTRLPSGSTVTVTGPSPVPQRVVQQHVQGLPQRGRGYARPRRLGPPAP